MVFDGGDSAVFWVRGLALRPEASALNELSVLFPEREA